MSGFDATLGKVVLRGSILLIKSFPAGPWQTNCYVIASEIGAECLIIDPGQGAIDQIKSTLEQNGLKPVAVLVTHGHLDHMWSVFPIASGYDIPALIHGDDRFLLSDPLAGVSEQTKSAMPMLLDSSDIFAEPSQVTVVSNSSEIEIAGLKFVVRHAPGHTAGSVLFDFSGHDRNVFTGDVLFAGAIGRTDLPGGSPEAMNTSLQNVILPLPDDANIFPGHGPSSTMTIERATNPYLRRVAQGLKAT